MKKLLLFIVILTTITTLNAQTREAQYNHAVNELNRRGEVYFSFPINNRSQLDQVSNFISIDNVKGNTVYAYANKKEFAEFVTHNLDYTILTAPSELYSVEMSNDPKQVLTWNYYPTYTAYETIMQQFATDHPQICKLITIATLTSGRKVLGLRITDNVNVEENEPEFLYSSSMHGDETTGYILMLHLADYLLSGYGTDTRITNMINNIDITICPLANPDGTYKGGNTTVNGATRTNANNVDLNRNYPDPENGPHPDGNSYQPETLGFMALAQANTFIMGANFHGGAEVINYPWDTWPRLAADDDWWQYVSREYADTVHINAVPGYLTDEVNGITNGYAWYEANGGRQDYMNYFRYCREATIEISNTKLLPASQLVTFWNYNYRSFLNYIEESGYGLRGIVTDSLTGAPLYAKVYISSFDKDSSQVYSDPQIGDYHRLLKAGTYNVTFSAAGHISKTISVQVADKQAYNLDVQLYDGSLATNFTADHRTAAIDQQVHFTDLTVGNPVSWNWTFEGGFPATSTEENPVVTYQQAGTYSVKLVVSRFGAVDSLAKDNYITVKNWYFMNNNTYTVCGVNFFDTGGPSSPYGQDENSVMTFLPAQPISKLKAVFNSFDVENGGATCANDKLLVYDGTSTSNTLIATLCGNSIPSSIMASNAGGALTFQFISNSINASQGWDISLNCISIDGIAENEQSKVVIYPNPVTNGIVSIEAAYPIQKVVISDMTGRIVSSLESLNKKEFIHCNWPSGIYMIQLQVNGEWIHKKLQVIN